MNRAGLMRQMSRRGRIAIIVSALLLFFVAALAIVPRGARADDAVVWREHDGAEGVRVHLYFFWTTSCPHCQDARPVVERFVEAYSWLELHSYELSAQPEAGELYVRIANSLGEEARAVPAFAFCGQLVQGWPGEAALDRALLACRDAPNIGDVGRTTRVSLPGMGEVDTAAWSLPVTTVVLAGLDAFNPCAFFVLLFLMSLLARTHDRRRMLWVSAVFVLFSGLWYFAFMATWLNVFLWVGELRAVTVVAGLVAIAMAALNIRDFVRPGGRVSLSIPESVKPSLFARMRELVRATSWASALGATVVLAAAANAYELLCTAGFPMIYTRVITLADLPRSTYYLYLALYSVVYVIPLAVIVVVFVVTLGSRKLQAGEGRALKLLSGVMMLGLGAALLFEPGLLHRLGLAAGLLIVAIAVTAGALAWERRRSRASPA